MASIPDTADQSKKPLISAALEYLRRGYSVIPTIGKEPAIKSWNPYQKRRPTEKQIRLWFSRPDVTGIGVIAGPVSGSLAIRDFDDVAIYDLWAAANPALAKTLPTVKTRRGRHVWCRSDWPHIRDMGDGEFRGAGYTLCPPSVHPSGIMYEWITPLPSGDLPFVPHEVFTGPLLQNAIDCVCAGSSPSSFLPPGSVTDIASLLRYTLPRRIGERNNCLWNLARGLKLNLGMANATILDLEKIVKQWYEAALPTIGTKLFSITWTDFRRAFKRAVQPLGMNVLDAAAMKVDPENFPAAAFKYAGEKMRWLVGFCQAIAASDPDGRFFLSCHEGASRLGLQPMQVWRLFRQLEDDGVIELRVRGYTGPGGKGKATRYRWIGDQAGEPPDSTRLKTVGRT